MYLFFNREKEPFRMEKGRSLVTNIDRKGKWRPDTGGDKKKKLTMLKRGCSLFCGYCLLFCGNRKKHRLKRKNGMRKKTGIKYETWILKFDIYTKEWTRQKMKCTPKVRHKRHYKIFCVNVKYGIQYGFRIFYLIALQNEENYEREESCSAWWGIK